MERSYVETDALKPKRDIDPHNQGETKPSPGTDAAKQKEPVSELNVQNSNKATAQMLKSGTQQSTLLFHWGQLVQE